MQAYGHSLLYLITCTVLFSLALVVSLRRANRKKSVGFFLGAYFWSLFLAVFTAFVVYSPLIERMPHFFRLAIMFYSMVMPFSWLYFRETLMPDRSDWRDLLLFLPLFLYVADYLPFLLLSGQDKLKILHALSDVDVKVSYREGWFMPAGGHYILLYLSIFYCWLRQFILMQKFRNLASLERGSDFIIHRSWLGWILVSQLMYFIPPLVSWATGNPKIYLSMINLAGLLAALAQGYFMLMNPEVLYGIPTAVENIEAMHTPKLKPDGIADSIRSEILPVDAVGPMYAENLSDETLDRIGESLSIVMAEKALFLDPNLRVYDLAVATGFHSYKISAYFRKRLSQNFYDYINGQRLEFCRRKLDEGEYLHKTLEAISAESGFQNRNTFVRTFKKYEGITPSEYVKRIEGHKSTTQS